MRTIPVSIAIAATIGFAGCGGGGMEPDEPAVLVTYIDRESGETVEGPAQPTPAVNPKTGAASLLRAGWCAECETWYPLPPDRNPGQVVCKKHGTPLSLEGPEKADSRNTKVP